MDLLETLHSIEEEFLTVVRTGSTADDAMQRAQSVIDEVARRSAAGTLDDDVLPSMRRILCRMHAIASGIDRFASFSSQLLGHNRERLKQTLADRGADLLKITTVGSSTPTKVMDACSRTEDELVQPYRLWFLDNFAWPYPESSERLRLLAQVPSHGRAQLSNWFVNSRRRSGWSRLAKKYTDGDRDAFAAFLRKIDGGNATEEEAEDVEKCKAHFMDKGNMLVRDGIEEVLTAASKGALTDGCVPPSKMARTRIFPIKIENPGNPCLSKKRGRIEDVEDPPSSPCSKRSTSGSWTDSSGVLSNDTGETSVGSNSYLTTPRRKSARVTRSPAAKSLRPTTKPAPSTPAHRAPVTLSRLPQTPHLRSFSSPLSSPTAGRSTRSGSTYRAVSSSFTIEQPNLAGELALPPPPFQITSNEHFVTLAAAETWSNLDPWLNFEVDLNAI
ncbi:BQ5605_C006g04224 [Microbotryum silenes-dioicae]|uniref:BQ5605_C006g04224 protein n=1 Tax=Microbotryum silenes-dioicae TaxID=796604 RepID=A0A2X0MAH0_9BASI|nr:BQ5605_C006g04224 [Microbotryum silenes-dioicae]